MSRKEYKEYFKELEQSESYSIAESMFAFIEDLHSATIEQRISYSQLASKIGKSPAYITRVMRGDYNLTIATMVKLARAVDCQVDIHVRKQSEKRGMLFTLVRGGKEPIQPQLKLKEDTNAEPPASAA